MRCLRTCAQLSVIGVVLPLAARAAAATAHCPLTKTNHPFSSIRLSNPLFQSHFKSTTSAAAEPEGDKAPVAAATDSSVLAVYVTVPDIEQGMLVCMALHGVERLCLSVTVLFYPTAFEALNIRIPPSTSKEGSFMFLTVFVLVCVRAGSL
jgi:hypothetical protein